TLRLSRLSSLTPMLPSSEMDITQLKYFFKVAHTEHMSKAAEYLNLSQPALSFNIRKLEAELGVELFTCKGKRLELNEYGSFLLNELEPIVESMDRVLDDLQAMKSSASNDVVIDGGPMYTFSGLMEAIQSVSNIYQGLTIRNVSIPVSELTDNIVSDKVDFAVIGIALSDSRLEHKLLSMDELVVVVKDNHPLANAEAVNLIALRNELFAIKSKSGVPADYVQTSERLCMQAGFIPKVAFRSSNRNELLSSVRTWGYVMITPINTLNQQRLDGLSVIRLLDEHKYSPLWIYWKAGKREYPQAKLVRETVIRYFKQRNADIDLGTIN
ncbi:MAG: LysR family transcriptional regulator, partial [Oscillospiraceae bacterium]|nr:LysR family transcriptional regulator [Oscillospiraceae bacterium]